MTAAGASPAGWQALDVVRIETGIPRYGADVDERTMPLECGLSGAVDFDKGCFIGQEALAKMHNRGQPPVLQDASTTPAPGRFCGVFAYATADLLGCFCTFVHLYSGRGGPRPPIAYLLD